MYLRRVFETLLEEAHVLAKVGQGWDEDDYQRSRVEEKIQILRGFLPAFLVENRSLYGILSKGIHELGEQECLDAFPIVRLGIELMLDEKLEETERKRKIKDAEKQISKLEARLARPRGSASRHS